MKNIIESFQQVELPDERAFLKIKETLTRMGVPSHKSKTLFQTCHILHKKDRYYIVHFKEMFLLDGKQADISDEDLQRRNLICYLLSEWGLLNLVGDLGDKADMKQLLVVPFKDKVQWSLVPKYTIGKKRS